MSDESRRYHGVVVSSTFTDLRAHRAALMDALSSQGLHPIGMEQDAARPAGTIVTSSMEKVRDAAAYACIVGRRYGQMPAVPENPDGLSITELEFREAVRLGRPILLFLMGDDHPIRYADIDLDPDAVAKLRSFRESAKQDGPAHRVYHEFNSIEEFRAAAVQSAAELRRLLDTPAAAPAPAPPAPDDLDGIPRPPALYAEPPYIGSHRFVGRASQLQTLDDWAAAAEPHPVLLFEAIGGTGKSMLTWEWTTRHANRVRSDWAGILWYSFYEKGAVMADFCRHALAYMTGRPLADFLRFRQEELTDLLMRRLRARPWLLIMDGLERVLVAYHRADAAQVRDEEAGGSDRIAARNPCAAIRPDDDRLLRELAGAGRSKILMTSRLVPSSMWNRAQQPIPGVLHEILPGLRPAEAEELLRSGGVRGDSGRIRAYLQAHCDCHPLVTGAVTGLVQDYLPDRGNFDAWEADPEHGGHLNLAELDLVQKRNHILRSAIDALPLPGRELLSILALLSESVDYPTLAALGSAEGSPLQTATVRDLERRGLLQYDRQAGRYDLHPVVRGVVVGALRDDDRAALGGRAVDYFSLRDETAFREVSSREELGNTLTVVRVLLQMGDFAGAGGILTDEDLRGALLYTLEAHAEVLSLLRPFFTPEWDAPATDIPSDWMGILASVALISFSRLRDHDRALTLGLWQVRRSLDERNWAFLAVDLCNVAAVLNRLGRATAADRVVVLATRLAEVNTLRAQLFIALLTRFGFLAVRGADDEARRTWERLDPMGRNWPRRLYLPGEAELERCLWDYYRGRLTEAQIDEAIELSTATHHHSGRRRALELRALWRADAGRWQAAAEDFTAAVALAREVGQRELLSEAGLALMWLRLGDTEAARSEAERLDPTHGWALLVVAELWHGLDDPAKAAAFAVEAYRWAWAEGEPFTKKNLLERSAAFLAELGVAAPSLPPYDPARAVPFDWEPEVRAAIDERSI